MKIENFTNGKEKIGIVGLGYVGLPLAVLFNTKYSVTGIDKDPVRVKELINSFDKTKEIDEKVLQKCSIDGISMVESVEHGSPYDAIIFAVNHKILLKEYDFNKLVSISKKDSRILIDLRRIINKENAEKMGFIY